MKVLQVIPGDESNPASMGFVRRQIPALVSLGVSAPTYFLKIGLSPARFIRGCQDLRRVIDEIGPDLVHAHFGTVTALACVLVSKRPVVITFRGSDLNPDPAVSGIRSFLQKLLSQFAALGARRIICVSEQLVGRLWWRRQRASVIPSGVDLDLFNPIDRASARARLGWAESERVVLFNPGGQGNENKRADLAMAAVQVASGIIGAPVKLHALSGGVQASEIVVLMSAADALVMTSDFEGSPNIVKEAIACNLPVVSVEVGDVIERLVDVTPSSICPRDPEMLGRALAGIVQSEVRSNGRSKAAEISHNAVARKIVNVYRDSLSGR